MFDGFTETFIDVDGARILARHGGSGPALLLLHGHPRTSATWHRVAPLLVAAGYTVVCADLRGYGRSTGPEPTADHSAHSKRAVAADMVAVMHELGHDQFAVVGHDRGSLVALRLALDHPDRVDHLIVVDCLPVTEHLSRADAEFALRWWHWFFFAQPDIPERVIWRDWTTDVRGHGIDSGHHVAEEAPDDFAEAIDAFLSADLRSVSGPE